MYKYTNVFKRILTLVSLRMSISAYMYPY